jgi:hypothetical protein
LLSIWLGFSYVEKDIKAKALAAWKDLMYLFWHLLSRALAAGK